MKKLSKITENLWADLQDRSSGEVTRKEDDVNLLDPDGMVDYIKKNYKSATPKWHIDAMVVYDNKCLSVLLFEMQSGYYGYLYFDHMFASPIIAIDNSFFDDEKNLLKDMEKKFTVIHNTSYVKIEPKTFKDFKITNKFFLEVLDFIISKLKEPLLVSAQPIKENLWADLQDRSSGEVTRKEDDVNILDVSDFCQYLKKIYEGEINYTSDDGVYALVFKEIEGGYSFYLYSCSDYMCIYSAPDGLMPPKELYDKLNTTYDIWEDRNEESGELELMISPKDFKEDKIPNMFFIEVLEFILNNLPNDFKAEIKKK